MNSVNEQIAKTINKAGNTGKASRFRSLLAKIKNIKAANDAAASNRAQAAKNADEEISDITFGDFGLSNNISRIIATTNNRIRSKLNEATTFLFTSVKAGVREAIQDRFPNATIHFEQIIENTQNAVFERFTQFFSEAEKLISFAAKGILNIYKESISDNDNNSNKHGGLLGGLLSKL